MGDPMMAALIGLAVGLVLGLRFKLLVLIPAMFLVVMASLVAGGVTWSNAVLTLLTVAALEIGYLCGVAVSVFGRRYFQDGRTIYHRN
jgi:hypothetical protein